MGIVDGPIGGAILVRNDSSDADKNNQKETRHELPQLSKFQILLGSGEAVGIPRP